MTAETILTRVLTKNESVETARLMIPGLHATCSNQIFFHAAPASVATLLRCAAAPPVRFEIYSIRVADVLQRTKLRCPVDVTDINWSPLHLALRILGSILYMAMVNAVFRQRVPTVWKCIELTAHHCISRIPIECEIFCRHSRQRRRCFASRRRITFELVL